MKIHNPDEIKTLRRHLITAHKASTQPEVKIQIRCALQALARATTNVPPPASTPSKSERIEKLRSFL